MALPEANRFSRRAFINACSGLGAISTFLTQSVGLSVRPALAQVRTPAKPPILPSVGTIKVKSVTFVGPSIGPTVAQLSNNICRLELAGGIHFRWDVDLVTLPGPKPRYFGQLALLQNVNYHRSRTATTSPHRECATSAGRWQLDGQYPYNRLRVTCAGGPNNIPFADAPWVLLEDPPREFETVTVGSGRQPAIRGQILDRFRTYLIWEITANNKPVTSSNRAQRYILARAEWVWQGTALNPPSQTPTCQSVAKPPNGWALDQTSPAGATVQNVFVGTSAGVPAPVFSPLATPNAWIPC
ncbi:MAG TPA: hypothetical protein VGX97_05335 [bacterium]|nr:hypothetical protein [bacterium]